MSSEYARSVTVAAGQTETVSIINMHKARFHQVDVDGSAIIKFKVGGNVAKAQAAITDELVIYDVRNVTQIDIIDQGSGCTVELYGATN